MTAAGDVSANLEDFEGKLNTVLDRLTKRTESHSGELGGRAILDFKLDLTDPANRDAAVGFINGVNSAGEPVSRMSAMVDLGGQAADGLDVQRALLLAGPAQDGLPGSTRACSASAANTRPRTRTSSTPSTAPRAATL